MKIIAGTHVDHALTPGHLEFVLSRFADRRAFFLETIELPEELSSLPCTLHGPMMGHRAHHARRSVAHAGRSGPVAADDGCRLGLGDGRVAVVGGLDAKGEMVLYTAYGGPAAPREPWDRGLDEELRAESERFWSEHALSR